jgi:hypothetical protein
MEVNQERIEVKMATLLRVLWEKIEAVIKVGQENIREELRAWKKGRTANQEVTEASLGNPKAKAENSKAASEEITFTDFKENRIKLEALVVSQEVHKEEAELRSIEHRRADLRAYI